MAAATTFDQQGLEGRCCPLAMVALLALRLGDAAGVSRSFRAEQDVSLVPVI
jgi:hypothetical protein